MSGQELPAKLGSAIRFGAWMETPEAGPVHALGAASGSETLLLWNFPEGYEWPDGDLDELVQEFMQFAGQSSRMTIEVRRLEESGYQQYVLGRRLTGGESADGPLDERITYANGQFELWVRSNELFDAAEATVIAEKYLETSEVSERYTLRRWDVDQSVRTEAP